MPKYITLKDRKTIHIMCGRKGGGGGGPDPQDPPPPPALDLSLI